MRMGGHAAVQQVPRDRVFIEALEEALGLYTVFGICPAGAGMDHGIAIFFIEKLPLFCECGDESGAVSVSGSMNCPIARARR